MTHDDMPDDDSFCQDMTATYSPQDDKLRLFPSQWLNEEEYAKVKALHMQWAPKQKCFYAVWTPGREDLLLRFCGHIEDETSTREERAEDRARRFEGYSKKREAEAQSTAAAVDNLAKAIPFGQPILIGHHSERRARKDAERIENGMRKAVNLWNTAEYWQDRARASLSHATYLEKPAVRYRRIKKLEAEKRKQERTIQGYEKARAFWSREDLTFTDALAVANTQGGAWGVWDSFTFPLAKYPRESPTYEGAISLWSALKDNIINEHQAAALMLSRIERVVNHARRWLAHIENRIAYERAMIGEGTTEGQALVPAQKWDLQKGGIIQSSCCSLSGELLPILRVNKKDGVILSVSVKSKWGSRIVPVEEITEYTPPTAEAKAAVTKAMTLPPLVNYPGQGFHSMTREEWSKTSSDYKDIKWVRADKEHGAYRYRTAMFRDNGTLASGPVFITNQKEVPIPPPPSVADVSEIQPMPAPTQPLSSPGPQPAPKNPVKAVLEEHLAKGVKVVVADQLYPTPAPVVTRMLEAAELKPGLRILEPSAGTGAIMQALADSGVDMHNVEAVELNHDLVAELQTRFPCVSQGDFLEYGTHAVSRFDRILMNPPFKNGADIRHIKHALTLLNPGGILVAMCAAGPRQQAALKPLAEASGGIWIPLPEGTFEGTNVHTALIKILRPDEEN